MPRPRVLAFVAKEIREMVPPTLFFLVGFNLIVLTGHLLLNDYRLQLFNYMVATTTALVVGKSVLLANALPFLRRFDGVPLIAPILFKTLVYCSAVLIVRFLEELIEYWVSGGSLSGTLRHVREELAWHRFAAVRSGSSSSSLFTPRPLNWMSCSGRASFAGCFSGAPPWTSS